MNNYYIAVNEILSRTVAIKADTIEEALKIAKELYKEEKIVLDYNDYVDYEIEDLNQIADDFEYTKEDIEGEI